MEYKEYIRDIQDFPTKGVNFKDITPLLKSEKSYHNVIKEFTELACCLEADVVTAIEARGFFFGAPLALQLNKPFIPLRKAGKLPFKTVSCSYDLEYGQSVLEIHEDAIVNGQRVIVVDDVLASGGTMSAAVNLLKKCGAQIVGCFVVIELSEFNARDKFDFTNLLSLVKY
ncbi:MAG: adenine phosphoribosyltransferase [SAR202 cluster bacterium]|nr:adenine phosphoribosyltransferase [SAR202 cluster bacterium]